MILTGCTPHVPPIRTPEPKTTTTHQALWEDTSSIEQSYSLKPEPYSLDSNQKDPELLGPQSTLKRRLSNPENPQTPEFVSKDTAANRSQPDSEQGTEVFIPRDEPIAESPSVHSMSRNRCIELIGQSKYDKYTQQFGSEEAAIRKCTIIERLQTQ